jgi:NADH pyrophosphatase NudC (nudix superfamily)
MSIGADVPLRFCGYCGERSTSDPGGGTGAEQLVCSSCGRVTRQREKLGSPALLVMTTVLAAHRMLLIKRGTAPYHGQWAPAGGFVEPGESLETAAVRELEEEVGIKLERSQLRPHAILSLPALSQVYVGFIATLDSEIPLRPRVPEALDARWFAAEDFPASDCWEPHRQLTASGHDVANIYARAQAGMFELYQLSDEYLRVFNGYIDSHYVFDHRPAK